MVVIRDKDDVHCKPTARPEVLYIADLGVVCNRTREVCYDHAGPSIGLTRLFHGEAAADALTADLRSLDPARDGRFAPAEGVMCRMEERRCLVEGVPDPLLSRTLFARRYQDSARDAFSATLRRSKPWCGARPARKRPGESGAGASSG